EFLSRIRVLGEFTFPIHVQREGGAACSGQLLRLFPGKLIVPPPFMNNENAGPRALRFVIPRQIAAEGLVAPGVFHRLSTQPRLSPDTGCGERKCSDGVSIY